MKIRVQNITLSAVAHSGRSKIAIIIISPHKMCELSVQIIHLSIYVPIPMLDMHDLSNGGFCSICEYLVRFWLCVSLEPRLLVSSTTCGEAEASKLVVIQNTSLSNKYNRTLYKSIKCSPTSATSRVVLPRFITNNTTTISRYQHPTTHLHNPY